MKKVKGKIKYSINVYYDDETKQYVGMCPELQYTGMGDSPEDAALNTDKAVKIALKWCYKNNTLLDVLKECGYKFYEINNKPIWSKIPTIINLHKETSLAS